MVAIAYRKWSFTRDFKFKALSGKTLVFWIGGCLWEVAAYDRWSHMDVQLYLKGKEKGDQCRCKSNLLAEPFFYLLDFYTYSRKTLPELCACYSRLGYGHHFINKQMPTLQKQFDETKRD